MECYALMLNKLCKLTLIYPSYASNQKRVAMVRLRRVLLVFIILIFGSPKVHACDKAAAEQNELLLNWQFRTKLNKVALVDSYVRSVVDEGTAILRTGWCRKTTTVKEMAPTYEYWAIESSEQEEQLQQAMQLKEENPRQYSETVPEEVKANVEFKSVSDVREVLELALERSPFKKRQSVKAKASPSGSGDKNRQVADAA